MGVWQCIHSRLQSGMLWAPPQKSGFKMAKERVKGKFETQNISALNIHPSPPHRVRLQHYHSAIIGLFSCDLKCAILLLRGCRHSIKPKNPSSINSNKEISFRDRWVSKFFQFCAKLLFRSNWSQLHLNIQTLEWKSKQLLRALDA